MELLDKLKWRYAAKAMNGEKVSDEKLERILEAARLAPTSSGLQPFEIYVVSNQDVKNQLKEAASNQPQVADASHVLVFAAWDTYTAERINYMFDLTNEVRGFTNDGWENYRQFLLNTYVPKSAEENFVHTAKQAYIAFGAAIIAAAFEGVDATPMEGFNPEKVDEILGLREKGLRSVLLLPLGYRDTEKDWLEKLEKVRKPKDKFITEVK
ncbi:NAD(P)H-dependent oxidoreductase [Cloacibacterium caeni]|uniref:NAD(P)H-dependent oxidoreductase n=1 Tax=Cloacibacterium caeni TaxID=2004710 RepID=UPI001BCFF9EF|nr:NAD(P)H-dependent oxidoreductase [Cloacibacterium caeni]